MLLGMRRLHPWAGRPAAAGIACAALLLAPAGGAAATAVRPCHPVVRQRVLPSWARTGFSDPRPRMPHSIARHGRIAALLFGFPLTAPPREDVSNKILWVSHIGQRPGEDLRWSGHRDQLDVRYVHR
jgi:hypothetical protein